MQYLTYFLVLIAVILLNITGFVGSIHGAEEAASKAELMEALKIYILALLNLEEVEF